MTLLEVELRTGRTHQIRACLSAIGHPIIGDTKYGGRKLPHITTQLLHAYKLILEDQVYEKESPGIREFWEGLSQEKRIQKPESRSQNTGDKK
jgi:23S rRNA pseudouridine955/2504/2580 synthase